MTAPQYPAQPEQPGQPGMPEQSGQFVPVEQRMVPDGPITDEGYGRYKLVDVEPAVAEAPEQTQAPIPLEPSVERPAVDLHVKLDAPKRRRWPYRLVGAGLIAVAALGTANWVADHMPTLPQVLPKADHELEVGVEDVRTIVVHDRVINFGDISSTFKYTQHTSLDRSGPFNCDTDINERVGTEATASILISEATIEIKKDSATIEVGGDLSLETHFDGDGGLPDIDIATGGVDFCKGDNEREWAELIAFGHTKGKGGDKVEFDGVIKNAGEIATACAVEAGGEVAMTEAIIGNAVVFVPELAELDPAEITVTYAGDFGKTAGDNIDTAVADLYRDFTRDSKAYYNETNDHNDVKLNVEKLIDCDEHDIKTKLLAPTS